MSNADTRQAIADALTQAGMRGHTARPAALNERDAWPQWRGSEYVAGRHLVTASWNVLIVLPQADDITADAFADEHGEAIIAALSPVLFVESIAPATIPVPGIDGDMYALLLTGRTE